MVDIGSSPWEVSLQVPFDTNAIAKVAYDALRIDKEPKRSSTKKRLSVLENTLIVHFVSEDLKNLRVAVNSFFKLLILVTKTIEQFGPCISPTYDYY